MENTYQQDKFKVLEKHKNYEIKFISATKFNKSFLQNMELVSYSDFKQGDIGNCGLIAALAAISQRPEFLSEIAPKIEHTSEGIKIHFKMFYKGSPTVVTIDDKLPFKFSDHKLCLIYAKSANNNELYLASLFEKAVVKLVCNSIYSNSEGISSPYVFSLFSDCMVSCCFLHKKDSKQNLINHLKYEVDNKSSVVLNIKPSLIKKPESICKTGHAYVVMDYNLEYKAIKLYNQNMCISYFTDFDTNLPLSITETADPNKGERWITLDQLKNRRVLIESLCSKNMYNSVFKVNKTLKQINYDKDYSKVKFAYKVFDIKQASTFMINIFFFSHKPKTIKLKVYSADNKKQNVKSNVVVSRLLLNYKNRVNGQAKSFFVQSFKLQPNKYIFQFEAKFRKISTKNVDLLLKIGSVSECSFKEVVEESED